MGGSVAGLVLAAGAGRRYGMPKALVQFGGRLLVERAVAALREAGCARMVVVLGARAAEVRARAELSDATVVVNADWASGMGSSLRAGLAVLESTGADAALVMLVDTPGVTSAAVRLVLAYAGPDALVTATYHGQPGHPVLLGRSHWPGIAAVAVGDVGARRYLAARPGLVTAVPCEAVADGTDLDEPVA